MGRLGVRTGIAATVVAIALGVLASPAAAVIAPFATGVSAVRVSGGFEFRARLYTYESDTKYHFEYGTTTGYGESVPASDADAGTQAIVDVSQLVTGLPADTTYHFRLVAQNAGGPTMSPDQTFNTSETSPPPGGGGEAPGGGGGGGGQTETPPPGSTVHLKVVSAKGKRILANGKGRTLYSLSAEKHGKFVCTKSSGCLSVWKPVLVPSGGSVKAPGAIKLGTIKRPEGGRQATYHGLPLYTFVQDTKRGQTKGEGLKDVGTWHAVKVPKPKR